MPNLGYDMESGTLQRWLKQVGDAIERGEPIAEVETDKTTVEMESMASGILTKIMLQEGESAPVGAAIAVIESSE